MVTIKDFIMNNENMPILIRSTHNKDTTDPLHEEKWKGMLHDIPKDLYDREVIKAGFGLAAKCDILVILEK